MKTYMSVLVLAMFVCCAFVVRAEEHLQTNSASAKRLLLAKVVSSTQIPIRPGLASSPVQKEYTRFLEKQDLKLSLNATGSKKEKIKESVVEPELPKIILLERDPFPNLYYVHTEDNSDREVSRDDVGRIWKLSPKATLLFPFGRWDNPGIKDRVLLGFCLRWKL